MIIENFPSNQYPVMKEAVDKGGQFVRFQYCCSVIVYMFSSSSGIYYVESKKDALVKGLKFTLLTFFLGWWFLPTGPYYTIKSLITNLKGGEDVSYLVLEEAKKGDPRYLSGLSY